MFGATTPARLSEADMKYHRHIILAGTTAFAALATLTQWRTLAASLSGNQGFTDDAPPHEHFDVVHTPAQWREMLTPPQFAVLREAATERPYSSPLNDERRVGVFVCAGCGLQLFSS